MRQNRGRTLLELIIAAAILSLLMAIVAPLCCRVKRYAQERTCLAHLHQIHQGFQLAADDSLEGEIESIHRPQVEKYVPKALWNCPLTPPGGIDDAWSGIQRVPRPTATEMGRVPEDAPFLEDAVHHRQYRGPWLVVTAGGSAQSLFSDCRPWYERNPAGQFLLCPDFTAR